jgi:hypothetical protein
MQNRLSFTGGVCTETVSVGGEAPVVTQNIIGIAADMGFFNPTACGDQPPDGGLLQYQGILGLGPLDVLDSIGTAPNDAYFTDLVASGVTDAFALLLCSVGGRLWFGGYDPQFATGAPQFTPLTSPTGWAISVSSLGLGAATLGAGDSQTIVDTGTQYYSMPAAAYGALMGQDVPALSAVFGSSTLGGAFGGHDGCLTPKGGQTRAQIDAALPLMTMTLPSAGGGSFTLSFPATSSYLVPVQAQGGGLQYCLDVMDSASTGNYSILGGPMMRANITLFDVAHGQLGFIPQGFCD